MTIESVTPCFVSYSHADDEDLGGVVSHFVANFEAIYTASTGRSIKLFMDRSSIGWGDDWRQNIRESVENATVFIPFVTMRYFQSKSCLEELMTFYSNANQLGVTGLLLPIVILGSKGIRADDPREEVRLIERLQYENLEKAWQAGYDSPEWRSAMLRLAERLQQALDKSEQSLIDVASNDVGMGPTTEMQGAADISALNSRAELLRPVVEETLDSLKRFFAISQEELMGVEWGSLSSNQQTARFIRAATRIDSVSADLEEQGNRLLSEVSQFDVELRAIVSELRDIGDPSATQLLKTLLSGTESLSKLDELEGPIDQIENVLKTTSLMNFQLRRSIRPAISGLQAFKVAMSTIASWKQLPS